MRGYRMILEKRLLQVAVAIAAAVPVATGLYGVLRGPGFLNVAEPWPVDLDSHFRFYSGIFLAIGVGWYSCIPAIEAKGRLFRMLAVFTFVGGLARLWSLFATGMPSTGHMAGLCMELVGVPLLVVWQSRIARIMRAA